MALNSFDALSQYELRELHDEPHFGKVDDDSVWVEVPVDGHPEWIVRAEYFIGSGGLCLTALQIKPKSQYPLPPRRPLSTVVIRSISPEALRQTARGWMEIGQQVGVDMEAAADELRQKPRPGSTGRSDLFYATVAKRYLELVGISTRPTADLAAEMNISQSSARDLLHQARVRKLLTKVGRGLAGGELTRKAQKLNSSAPASRGEP